MKWGYADAVTWAANKGITGGIGNGLFGSDNNCTRAQIVTFLYRYMGIDSILKKRSGRARAANCVSQTCMGHGT